MDTEEEKMTKAMAELQVLIADWVIERQLQPLAVAAILMATSSKIYQAELEEHEFVKMMESVVKNTHYAPEDTVLH
tara:strand:+ start:82 stop:309 length:228 start_codon:yes stop_codon:yes gene_type:complete